MELLSTVHDITAATDNMEDLRSVVQMRMVQFEKYN